MGKFGSFVIIIIIIIRDALRERHKGVRSDVGFNELNAWEELSTADSDQLYFALCIKICGKSRNIHKVLKPKNTKFAFYFLPNSVISICERFFTFENG
jgi:hypothetical protein